MPGAETISKLISDPAATYRDIMLSWINSKHSTIELPLHLLPSIRKLLLDPDLSIEIKTELITMPPISSIVSKCKNASVTRIVAAYNIFLKFLAHEISTYCNLLFEHYEDVIGGQQLRDRCLLLMVASEDLESIKKCARLMIFAKEIQEVDGPFRAYMLNTFPESNTYQANSVELILEDFISCEQSGLLLMQTVVEMPCEHVICRLENILKAGTSPEYMFTLFRHFAQENLTLFHTPAGYTLLSQAIIHLDVTLHTALAKNLLDCFKVKEHLDKNVNDKIESVIEFIMLQPQISTELYDHAEALLGIEHTPAPYIPAFSVAKQDATPAYLRHNSVDVPVIMDIRKLTPLPTLSLDSR